MRSPEECSVNAADRNLPLREEQLHAFVDGELGRAEACAMMIRIANDTALAERVAAYAQQRLDLTLLSEALDAACGQRAPVTLEALFCRAVRSARSG